MRIKKRFLFDEEKEVEKILKEGFPNGKIDYGEMYLIAKYFRQKGNLGSIRLERKIINFCKKQDKDFNVVTNREAIKKWTNSALNYNLRKIDKVWLTNAEVGFLKTIESNRDRKLLFMMLVFSKALKNANTRRDPPAYKKSNNYYVRYNNFKDIIKMSELTNISEVTFAKILYKYKDYFTFYTPEKELVRLEFADKNNKKDILIENLDNPVEAYQEIFGKNMTYCEICGVEILKTNYRQKYCEDCALKVKYEKVSALKREKRKKME